MEYDQHLLVSRPASGTPDGLGGETPSGEIVVVHDAPADVQDGGEVIRMPDGTIVQEGDATVFALEAASTDGSPVSAAEVSAMRAGDDAVITWSDGTKRKATVRRVVRLDSKIVVAYK